MATTQLSAIEPDFAALQSQLQTVLASKDSWKDLIKSSTGQTILEMLAQIGELDQYQIEQMLRQCYIDTAVTDSAVKAGARTLGVRLLRKLPTQMDVLITPSGSAFTIPAYSVFQCNGVTLFNRVAINVAASPATTVATLYEGEIVDKALISDGTDFQAFKTTERDFSVSNVDVLVTVSSTPKTVTQAGIWEFPLTPAVSDMTTSDGELLLTFGSDEYGYKPGVGITVNVKYVVTRGVDAGDSSLSGREVTSLSVIAATIASTSGLYGGGSEWNVNTMRKISPLLFVSRNRATTETDFVALAASYPGVLDAAVWGQHRVAPTDVRYMNTARVTLLTNTPFTTPQWNDFVAWYTARTMYPIKFYRADPFSVTVNITATVYCRPQTDLVQAQAKVTAGINALFAKEPGILGKNIYKSDVYRAIQSATQDVEYVELTAPTQDALIDFEINNPTITQSAGGTLVPGNFYSYGISVTSILGESLVKRYVGVILDPGMTRITIDWDQCLQSSGYKIYGRGPTTYGLLGTNTLSTFTDNGSVSPGGVGPTIDTAGIFYPILGTLNLVMRYTERD